MTETAARSTKSHRSRIGASTDFYGRLYRTEIMDRIGLIARGVSAIDARQWLDMPVLGRTMTLKALDMSVATFNKKVKANGRLSSAESERVLGLARLVGQVEAMVEEAGDPLGFDARAWLARWLAEPLPALGNAKPIDFMSTIEGQKLVSQKLAQVGSSAYA